MIAAALRSALGPGPQRPDPTRSPRSSAARRRPPRAPSRSWPASARTKLLLVIGRTDEVGARSVRNLPGVHVISPDQLNTYDVLNADDVVFSVEALNAYIEGASKTDQKEECRPDGNRDRPRDIILAPVISEKSYGLIGTTCTRSWCTRIRTRRRSRSRSKIFNVKVDSVNTANRQGKPQTHPGRLRPAQEHQARHRDPGRRQQTDRSVRSACLGPAPGTGTGLEETQRHGNSASTNRRPRSPRCQRLRFRRDHSRSSGEVAGSPLHGTGGRNAHGRITTRHRAVAWRAYRVIDFRRHDKDGVNAKVAHIGTTRTAPRTSHCSTSWTARSATSSPPHFQLGRCDRVGPERRHQARQQPAAAQHPGRYRDPRGRAAPGGGAKMARSAGVSIQLLGKGRHLRRPAYAVG